jgi:hypothetical protein
MIAAVFFIPVGQAVLAASLPLPGWFALAVIVDAAYSPLAVEPWLVKRFGSDYLAGQPEHAEMDSQADAVASSDLGRSGRHEQSAGCRCDGLPR